MQDYINKFGVAFASYLSLCLIFFREATSQVGYYLKEFDRAGCPINSDKTELERRAHRDAELERFCREFDRKFPNKRVLSDEERRIIATPIQVIFN